MANNKNKSEQIEKNRGKIDVKDERVTAFKLKAKTTRYLFVGCFPSICHVSACAISTNAMYPPWQRGDHGYFFFSDVWNACEVKRVERKYRSADEVTVYIPSLHAESKLSVCDPRLSRRKPKRHGNSSLVPSSPQPMLEFGNSQENKNVFACNRQKGRLPNSLLNDASSHERGSRARGERKHRGRGTLRRRGDSTYYLDRERMLMWAVCIYNAGNNCLSVAGKEPSRYSEREMFICFLRILRGRSTQVALCRFQNVHDDSAHAINVQILEMGHSDMISVRTPLCASQGAPVQIADDIANVLLTMKQVVASADVPEQTCLETACDDHASASSPRFNSVLNMDKPLKSLLKKIPEIGVPQDTGIKDDTTLFRFLSGKKWDISDALEQYRAMLKWREDMKVDDIFKWEEDNMDKCKAIKDLYPSEHYGFDREGRPLLVHRIGLIPAETTPGEIKLVFDNTYSYLTSKTVQYLIALHNNASDEDGFGVSTRKSTTGTKKE
eukprot:jgi/Bigna1/78900/fgenesh1_pg.58_\